jgi:serine/threonine protein kinase
LFAGDYIVLYEMISGRLPFRGETPAAVVYSILHDQPQPLTALRSGLPVELDRILKKVLSKAPSERYQHIDEMLVDLKILLSSSGDHARSDRSYTMPPPKTQHRRYRYAGAAALVVVFMLLIWQGLPLAWFRESGSQAKKATIAVLPLANLSASGGQDYFSDGMTDALITELGSIDTVRVISRTSVMRYKGSQETLSKIAANSMSTT